MIAMTPFMTANGQMPTIALYAVANTAPARFSTRKRSTRACVSEAMTSSEPTQPTISNHTIRRDYRRPRKDLATEGRRADRGRHDDVVDP